MRSYDLLKLKLFEISLFLLFPNPEIVPDEPDKTHSEDVSQPAWALFLKMLA